MGVTNVTAGKPNVSGAIYHGPLSATLPTSTSDALTGFTKLGYVSDDGVVNTNSPDTDTIKAWGGDTVLVIQNEKTDEFQLTLLEVLDPNVLKIIYGDSNVTGTLDTGVTVEATTDEPDEGAWVIDMTLRGGVAKRIVIPDGKISEIGDITYKDDEAVGYEITIQAMADANGTTHYEYLKA